MGSGTIRVCGLFALGVLHLYIRAAAVHTWLGLPAAYSTVAWIGLTGLLMPAIPPVVRVEGIGA